MRVTASDGNGGSVPDIFDLVVSAANSAPTVANAIPNQVATVGTTFSYSFPADTFDDPDGDTLAYEADLSDGSNLPTWLTFTGTTRTFSGTPQAADVGTVSVRVTASDGNGGSVADTFDIDVNAAPDGGGSAVEGNGIVEGDIRFADGTSVADLPQGATINVILAEVTNEGALYTVIEQQTCTVGEGTCSSAFALAYDANAIDPRNQYALIARVEHEGRLIYINDEVHYAITSIDPDRPNPEDQDIEVVPVP